MFSRPPQRKQVLTVDTTDNETVDADQNISEEPYDTTGVSFGNFSIISSQYESCEGWIRIKSESEKESMHSKTIFFISFKSLTFQSESSKPISFAACFIKEISFPHEITDIFTILFLRIIFCRLYGDYIQSVIFPIDR